MVSAKGGSNNGAGGLVSLQSKDDILIHAIDISGSGTGRAGVLSIRSDEGQVTIDTGTIALAATASGQPAAIRANSGEDADGPENEIFAKTGWNINGIIDYRGRGAGKGGKLKLTTPGAINFTGGQIWADGGEDSGDGGSITLSTGVPVNLSSASDFLISATGGQGFGLGGRVTIDKVSTLKVNKVIVVNPGAQVNPGAFAGSISLNGVLCQQWLTDFGSGSSEWPHSYWAGVNPTDPTTSGESIVATRAHQLPGVIRASLDTNAVQIYAFQDDNSMGRFFDGSPGNRANAFGRTINSQLASAAHAAENGGTSFKDLMGGTIHHELGHMWDFLNGGSTSGNFRNAVDADETSFNVPNKSCAVAIDASLPAGSPSLCAKYNPPPATNWKILHDAIKSEGHVYPPTDYVEFWARAFAYEAQKRAGKTSPKEMLTFIEKTSDQMAQQITYMQGVFNTGAP